MKQLYVLLIEILFAIPIFMLLARILLQAMRAPFTDPLYQWLLTTLNPVLRPIEQVIPKFRNWNLAAIVLLYLVCLLKMLAIFGAIGVGALMVFALAQMLTTTIGLFYILMIIRIILSFVQANPHNALIPLVYRLTEPVLAPIRRRLPAVGPMDFSPMVFFLLLLLLQLLLVAPLQQWGLQLTLPEISPLAADPLAPQL